MIGHYTNYTTQIYVGASVFTFFNAILNLFYNYLFSFYRNGYA